MAVGQLCWQVMCHLCRQVVSICCRPRKGLPEAHDIGDIQHFFIIVMPLSRAALARLIVVGKKRLPERGQRFWAAVLAAAPAVSIRSLCLQCTTGQLT